MAAASTTAPRQVDLEALIQSLPACRRCRDCRRGCDTLLPRCKQCTKAGVECMFYDHGRNEYLPRSYIAELIEHVRRITARSHPSPATTNATPQDSTSSASVTVKDEPTAAGQPHYEHQFAYAGGSYRFLGAESCLLRSPKLQQAQVQTPVIPDNDDWELVFKSSAKNHDLVLTYLDIIQPLYPILDPTLRFLEPDVPSDLDPVEIFSLNMIYSIGCYLEPGANRKRDPRMLWPSSGKLDFHHVASDKYRCLAESFFKIAMDHLEAATTEKTIATLRSVLLLAINSLFDPKSGNIGQQIALASRLALNLELHEQGPGDAELMRNMRSTIFSIENEIASTLDRPATFPEPTECDIYFDKNNPADYLCSLYRLQNRFRKGDHTVKRHLPALDDRNELKPGLRMALHQTHLLLTPCWGTAWHVLDAAVSSDSIHTFLTPQWVYRAGCVLIQNMPNIYGGNLIQLYSNALVVLELSSGKWPSTGILRDSLVELMQHTKAQVRPPWENGGLQLFDNGTTRAQAAQHSPNETNTHDEQS
ncbi:hypothetical protein K491DRAFT_343774 [Lophiostoma macrostomum CBS 122681]|uniref:Zn(2)-C6 fungal-type domain-containing protein n=1 Tax=Lophiostoma macrostomum CBS 122681 TaxID=1314788 RepID=A0A6A6TBC8_9PLEO|nr:hypothetical protein K491DRAFT_343774 [Lophiostoma macrostomum CBS 122681]